MIYLDRSIMELGGGEVRIVRWAVWFLTMRGYHPTLAEALKHAEETDMPPELIRPVPVAIGENGAWEPVHK
jgi:hypothetical protein